MNILSRLTALEERLISGDDNCAVTVTYEDGNIVKVPYYPDFTGYFDNDGTLHESEIEKAGWDGKIETISCNNWRFSGIISLAAALWGVEYVEH